MMPDMTMNKTNDATKHVYVDDYDNNISIYMEKSNSFDVDEWDEVRLRSVPDSAFELVVEDDDKANEPIELKSLYAEVYAQSVKAGQELRKLVDMMTKLSKRSGDFDVIFRMQRVVNTKDHMDDASVAVLASAMMAGASAFKIMCRTRREETACLEFAIDQIMGRLYYTPEWWDRLRGYNPYWSKESNNAVKIVAAAMSCMSRDYCTMGGVNYGVDLANADVSELEEFFGDMDDVDDKHGDKDDANE